MDPEVNPAFVEDYYRDLDHDDIKVVETLAKYYNRKSLFSYEGTTYAGPKDIVQLFTSDTYQPCKHTVVNTEYLPVPLEDDYMMIVKVVGTVSFKGGPEKNFSQTFQMKWDDMGRMYVDNAMLNLFEIEQETVG